MGLHIGSTSVVPDFVASHFMERGVCSWGSVAWSCLDEELCKFEGEDIDHGCLFHNLMLSQEGIGHLDVDEQWDMISSLTVCLIWKARCKEVFDCKK